MAVRQNQSRPALGLLQQEELKILVSALTSAPGSQQNPQAD